MDLSVLRGEAEKKNNLIFFRNPVLKKGGDYRPLLKTMSLDIETGTDGSIYSAAFNIRSAGSELNRIFMRGSGAVSGSGCKRCIVNASPGKSGEGEKEGSRNISGNKISSIIEYCSDEKELIIRIIDFIHKSDPDVIIGWHVIGFDLKFIERRASFYSIPVKIGRGHRHLRINERRSGMFSAAVEGRLVIDGPQALRTAFYKFDSFSLENVSQELLGRGKGYNTGKRQGC